jgi:lipopolysaccharide/colanic/teichoic acid biosynthesis glycosyltransferase
MPSRPQRAEPSLDATPPNTRPARYAGALAEKAELTEEAAPFDTRRTRGGPSTVVRPARDRRGLRRHVTEPAGHASIHAPHLRVVTEAPPQPPVWRLGLKRALDILGALVGLVCSAPLLLLLAPLVRLDSPGRAVFAQQRVGRRGRTFACYKLRTMRADAEHLLEADAELRAEYEANGFKVPLHADPRITPLGRFLRVTSLDELPQFWNVLRGDMSLVGPAPDRGRRAGALRPPRGDAALGAAGPHRVVGRARPELHRIPGAGRHRAGLRARLDARHRPRDPRPDGRRRAAAPRRLLTRGEGRRGA